MLTIHRQIADLHRPAERAHRPPEYRQHSDALDRALRLREAARTGHLDPDLRQWLAAGLEAFLHESVALDRALRLAPGRGQAHVADLLRRRTRDEALRRAAETIHGDHWHRATELARRLHLLRAGHAPLDACDAALAQALEAGTCPTSAAGIDRAMHGKMPFHLPYEAGTLHS